MWRSIPSCSRLANKCAAAVKSAGSHCANCRRLTSHATPSISFRTCSRANPWRAGVRYCASMAPTAGDVSYLGQSEAQQVDEQLMGPLGFSVDQLMELAGLACATSLASEYPKGTHKRVLVIAGPGNNGGDGLVAARHLYHFGYTVQVAYPKQTDKPLYHGLVKQLQSLNIRFVPEEELVDKPLSEQCDVVMDAIFGFSFKGAPRPPFDKVLDKLRPEAKPPTLVSVDCPSGWDVEKGDEAGDGLRPDMLVSLTAPKQGAKGFDGTHHYLGGRFVPPEIAEKFSLRLPEYPGTACCVRIGGSADTAAGASNRGESQGGSDVAAMRQNYDKGGLAEEDAPADPMQMFDRWFQEATRVPEIEEPNKVVVASADGAGSPSARYVLMKGYDERGIIFYSNYGSRKARELANGRASLCFYWEPLQHQVRVDGSVEKLSAEESDRYFHSRPRGSQIGALVSPQSQVLPGGRADLEERNRQLQEKYSDESVTIPRPDDWGGYLVRPSIMEFWQGRPSRLHDRLEYSRDGGGSWSMHRLAP